MSEARELTFLEHLRELRTRLTHAVLFVLAAFLVCYSFHVEIFDVLSAPVQEGLLRHGIYQFRALKVTEPIMVYLKVSFVAALMFASPYALFQIWMFVAPGLHRHERRFALPVLFFASCFFLLGVAFCHRLMLPFLTDFLVGIGEETASVAVDVTLESALSYAMTFLLVFGVVFELPLALFFLTLLEVVTPKSLLDFFRYWVVLAFVLGAMLTPPDPISQFMMAVPLIVLYGIGVGGSFVAYGRIRAATAEGGGGVARLWTITGATLLSILVAGFAWALRPPGTPAVMSLVDPAATTVVGARTDALQRTGHWSLLRNELAAAWPELAPAFAGGDTAPEEIVLFGEGGRFSGVILAGEGIMERLPAALALERAPVREGKATLFGTLGALRSGTGLMAACYPTLCVAGSSRVVVHRIRSYAAEVEGDALVPLQDLRRSGPAWAQIEGRDVNLARTRWPDTQLPAAASVALWLSYGSEGQTNLNARFAPTEGTSVADLERDARAVRFGAAPSVEASGTLGVSPAFVLRMSEARNAVPRTASKLLGPPRRLTPPSLAALVGEAPPAQAATQWDVPPLLQALAPGGMALTAARTTKTHVEITWSASAGASTRASASEP